MYSIFIIALIVPSVLGCCFPDKFSIDVHHSDDQRTETIFFDYKINEVWIFPMNGSEKIHTIAADLSTGKTYQLTRGGKCTIGNLANHYKLKQCISPSATKTSIDVDLGINTPNAEAYIDDYKIIVATIDNVCTPLVRVDEDMNGVKHLHTYYKYMPYSGGFNIKGMRIKERCTNHAIVG